MLWKIELTNNKKVVHFVAQSVLSHQVNETASEEVISITESSKPSRSEVNVFYLIIFLLLLTLTGFY